MEETDDSRAKPVRRFRHRLTGMFAILAMGSWIILAAIPMVVAIVALT